MFLHSACKCNTWDSAHCRPPGRSHVQALLFPPRPGGCSDSGRNLCCAAGRHSTAAGAAFLQSMHARQSCEHWCAHLGCTVRGRLAHALSGPLLRPSPDFSPCWPPMKSRCCAYTPSTRSHPHPCLPSFVGHLSNALSSPVCITRATVSRTLWLSSNSFGNCPIMCVHGKCMRATLSSTIFVMMMGGKK